MICESCGRIIGNGDASASCVILKQDGVTYYVHQHCYSALMDVLHMRFGPGLGPGFLLTYMLCQKYISNLSDHGATSPCGVSAFRSGGVPSIVGMDALSGSIPSGLQAVVEGLEDE